MMLCPTCAQPLRTVERQGMEIEHCTQCGGIWLDAGELDQLIRQEALVALTAGQQALRRARNDREYDGVVDATEFRWASSIPPASVYNNYAFAALSDAQQEGR